MAATKASEKAAQKRLAVYARTEIERIIRDHCCQVLGGAPGADPDADLKTLALPRRSMGQSWTRQKTLMSCADGYCCRPMAVVVGALLALGSATPAWAGDDSACYMNVPAFPADGASNVLRNTIILDPACGYGEIGGCLDSRTARDASDNLVLFHPRPVEDNCISIHYPERLLASDTVYCVDELYTCFTTGELVDDTPPEFVLGSDGPEEGLDVAWTGSPDILFITMTYGSGLGILGIAEVPQDPLVHSTGAKENGDTLTLTAWDRAGKGTAQTVKLNMPGCQTGVGVGFPWLPWLVLLGLFARRRYRVGGEKRGRFTKGVASPGEGVRPYASWKRNRYG